MLGFGESMLGHLRRYLGAVRLQPSIDRPCNGEHEQNGDNGKPPACHARLLVGLALLLLSLCERFAGMASVAAGLDDRYENIMREFHPAGVVAVFIGEEPAVDQFIENGLGDIRAGERIIEGATVAISGRREKLVLDKGSHAHRKVLNGPEVEFLENFLLFDVEEIGGDFRIRPEREAPLIEFPQHQAQ
jgi:hypothetical protein